MVFGSSSRETKITRVPQVTEVKAAPGLMENSISWKPADWSVPLDHYRVEGRKGIGEWQLIRKTIFPEFRHDCLSPQGEKWYYRIRIVDAAGSVSVPSRVVQASSFRSVTTGIPIVSAGKFDRQSVELKFAPNKYKQIPIAYPDGKIQVAGAHPQIPYLLPGPKDSWAGKRSYSLEWEFDIPSMLIRSNRKSIHLALWFIDTTKLGGELDVRIGQFFKSFTLPQGATAGSKVGDARRNAGRLNPGQWEVAIPSECFAERKNKMTLTLKSGGWIAWDAIGLFAVK